MLSVMRVVISHRDDQNLISRADIQRQEVRVLVLHTGLKRAEWGGFAEKKSEDCVAARSAVSGSAQGLCSAFADEIGWKGTLIGRWALTTALEPLTMATMTKAFAYLRVSGKGQIQGDGFPRQLAAIRSYAQTHDVRIVQVFREEGVCGAMESADRPAWSELMIALHADGVKTIIIEKLDRLARDLMVQEATIGDLQKHNFTLISVAEPDLMATDPTRILMRQLMGAVAQYDKSQIVLKLRGARQRMKAAEGRCEGRKPYGDRDGETAVVERMRAMRAAGMAYRKIAAALNAETVPTRTAGARWRGCTVNGILNRFRRQ
jgi:DNA invertase Pin-like site-specific DNA recombinase